MATGTLFPFANLATGNVDNRWDCAMIHVQRQLIGLKHAEYVEGESNCTNTCGRAKASGRPPLMLI